MFPDEPAATSPSGLSIRGLGRQASRNGSAQVSLLGNSAGPLPPPDTTRSDPSSARSAGRRSRETGRRRLAPPAAMDRASTDRRRHRSARRRLWCGRDDPRQIPRRARRCARSAPRSSASSEPTAGPCGSSCSRVDRIPGPRLCGLNFVVEVTAEDVEPAVNHRGRALAMGNQRRRERPPLRIGRSSGFGGRLGPARPEREQDK